MDKKYRVPRKKKKKIPSNTFYCYKYDVDRNEKDPISNGFWIKTCCFYKNKDGLIGYCKLLKDEIEDQVKICDQKEGDW